MVRCVITDDEPIARDIIVKFCGHFPELHILAICANALEAKKVLHQEEVDLLFLDINMPVLDGISFLKTLRNPPQVIFTTAYKEYALNAFDLSAVDYLLKPFSLERFMVAVDKALDKISGTRGKAEEPTVGAVEDALFVKADGKIFRIQFRDMVYAEANGNYTKIVCKNQTVMPMTSFSSFEEQLPKSLFIRIHRSFIINKNLITLIEGNRVFVNGLEIPIGSNYKETFMRELKL
ncbi:LytTR family DNA-binding domain-containing protein [Pollutibacter soli]|uniref:LytR/AlgR family response regulator transcription factor n=1 Tax=Pollutibacter soli TaxID=3034157 RepID=UPI003014120B